jgi:large subunit ribosomal protein L23
MHTFDILVRPIITEKNTLLLEQNKYTFEVASKANKVQIKEAVERAFKVKVAAVNVCNMPGKMRRVGRSRGYTSPWRKAVVTLERGHKIELFEGV